MNKSKSDHRNEPYGKTCSLCGEKDPNKLTEDLFNKGFYICHVCLKRTQRHDTMVRLGLEIQPEHD